jgi:hypothetical protein
VRRRRQGVRALGRSFSEFLTGLAADLEEAVVRHGWADPAAAQAAVYAWAESGIPVDQVELWLHAGVARPQDAAALLELAIGPEVVQQAGLGEQLTAGLVTVDDAAGRLLGLGARDLGQLRVGFRAEQARHEDDQAELDLTRAQLLAEGRVEPDPADEAEELSRDLYRPAWRRQRLQRLRGLLAGQPVPSPLAAWVRAQPDVVLVAIQERAVEQWAAPLTVAVARRELQRLGGPASPGSPAPSAPLAALVAGALAVVELDGRLGARLDDPPGYLTALLGGPPAATATRRRWIEAAVEVERYRLAYGVTDSRHALGDPRTPVPAGQRQAARELRCALTRLRADLDRADTPRAWLPSAAPVVRPDERRPDELLGNYLIELGGLLWSEEASATAMDHAQAAAAGMSDAELAAHWQLAMAHRGEVDLEHPAVPAPGPLVEAAMVLEALERRVELRVAAAVAEPPGYVLTELGPPPSAGAASEGWRDMVADIEEYRVFTATTDPRHALGWPVPPDGSWQQCWRDDLRQDLAVYQAWRQAYRQHLFGAEPEQVARRALLAYAADAPAGVRPDQAALDDAATQPADVLHRRVRGAVPLLAARPRERAGTLHGARDREAALLAYRRVERVALAGSEASYAAVRLALGRGARAARATARQAIARHQQVLTELDGRLAQAATERADLEQQQAAYLDWRVRYGPEAAEGLAAAHELQAREARVLDGLAADPPAYLLAELGALPTSPAGRLAWRHGVERVERHRATYGVTDPQRALGEEQPMGPATGRTRAAGQVRQDLDQARAAIDHAARDVELLAPDLGDGPPGLALDP